jgi:hypothetical protein
LSREELFRELEGAFAADDLYGHALASRAIWDALPAEALDSWAEGLAEARDTLRQAEVTPWRYPGLGGAES